MTASLYSGLNKAETAHRNATGLGLEDSYMSAHSACNLKWPRERVLSDILSLGRMNLKYKE